MLYMSELRTKSSLKIKKEELHPFSDPRIIFDVFSNTNVYVIPNNKPTNFFAPFLACLTYCLKVCYIW